MRVFFHPPTHSTLTTLAFLYAGALSLHRTKGQIRQSSATYAAGAIVQFPLNAGWWFIPWELGGIWLIEIVVLPVGLQSPSAPSVFPLTLPLGSPSSVQWLPVSIWTWYFYVIWFYLPCHRFTVRCHIYAEASIFSWEHRPTFGLFVSHYGYSFLWEFKAL